MLVRRLAGLFALLLLAVALPARAAPTYPAFTGLVVDDANVLSQDDRAALTRKLEALQQKTGVQFAVATVPSLDGLEIEPYANALFRKWQIGQKSANNGLLLILAPNEHKLRFEVGYGLEGTLTDAQSKLILHDDMVPKLKANDPGGALNAGVDDAIEVLTAKTAELPSSGQAASSTSSDGDGGISYILLIYGVPIIFVVVFILAIRKAVRGGGGWTRGGTWPSGTSSSDSTFGSDSSSSSSGSDSFSGGGGDSGGGGASDSY